MPDQAPWVRRVIEALRDHPAYLLVFSVFLVVMSAFGGVFGSGAFQQRPELLLAMLGITFTVLMAGSLFAIRLVEPLRVSGTGHLETLDQEAREAFHAGYPAKDLSGLWYVTWYRGQGPDRKRYETEAGRPYPEERVRVLTSGPRVTAYHFDSALGNDYWMDGRLSEQKIATLTYWSRPKPGIRDLTGVVFLKVDDRPSAQSRRMTGWWIGHVGQGDTRDARIVHGELDWHRESEEVRAKSPVRPTLVAPG